ncbi:hypothetical protein DVH24_022736 [Malus domestica]|uniref:KIB1-4 beta-propeller domain-containing protein n=2 Tax=Malus domestica TaxID=3750 RepID=A0A498KSF3_MALDO|nr:hypothetical protein DVH24_022736 [Malus domestica]
MPRESMDPDWAALSRELLNLVVERLETPKEFSLVCESWRSAAKDIQTHRADTTTPMILISSHTDKDKWHLYNPLDDKVHVNEFVGLQKDGQCAVNGHRTVSLINPFLTTEKSIVRLPPLNPPKLGYNLSGSNIRCRQVDCIVMVMCEMYIRGVMPMKRLTYNGDWSALPRELLNLVVERTESPKEFSFVCKSWRSVAKDTQSYCAMTTNPLLMIPSQSYYKWSLYNPVDDKVLKTQLNLARQRFCGSSKGWLIVADKNRLVSLINPFFSNDEKKIIRLPPLSLPSLIRLRRENYVVYKATISADPILNADNCIVTVVYEDICQLAFLRLNKDSQWTYILEKVDRGWWRTVEEVVQFEDRFYAVDLYGKVFSFDVTTPSVAPVKVVGREFDGENCYVTRYLVVCNEKTILMVQRCMVGLDGHETKRISVFELNISKGEWTEKNSLGDVALFVGDNSSIYVCASKSGCRANCIYFIHDNIEGGFGPRGAYDYGVYNVEEKRFLENPFHRDAGILMSKTVVSPIWIAPTYNL